MAPRIDVSRMRESDVDGAVTCIQIAFKDDPYHHWVFDQSQFNAERNKASLASRCQWGMEYGLFYVAKDLASPTPDKVLGVAMWLPPSLARSGSSRSWSEWAHLQRAEWSLWLSQIWTNLSFRGRGGLIVSRYWAWKAAQATAQGSLWDDDRGYYFCNIVTVLPEHQGKGIGRQLCEHVMAVADAEGRTCYLESSRLIPNVRIYEKMGFELCSEMLCKDGADDAGITLYCMKRPPKGPDSTSIAS